MPHVSQQCANWHRPPPAVSAPGRWVVFAVPVLGLGDYLAGLASAYVLAAATRRHFYVRSPFIEGGVSFAPYEIPPPVGLDAIKQPRRGGPAGTGCRPIDAINHSATVLVNPVSANRGCIQFWLADLLKLGFMDALVPGGVHQTLETPTAGLLYGCVLREVFQPTPDVAALIPKRPPSRVVAVHLRFGDQHMHAQRRASCTKAPARSARTSRLPAHTGSPASRTSEGLGGGGAAGRSSWAELIAAQLAEIAEMAMPLRGHTTFRIESDDPCARDALVAAIRDSSRLRNVSVAPLVAHPLHFTTRGGGSPRFAHSPPLASARDQALQLASWFAFAESDEFVFKLLCERSWGARLSSWSVMAMLFSSHARFRMLCEHPANRSHGCSMTSAAPARAQGRGVRAAGDAVASCDIAAINTLALGGGHTVRHHAASHRAAGQLWSLGNLVRL